MLKYAPPIITSTIGAFTWGYLNTVYNPLETTY